MMIDSKVMPLPTYVLTTISPYPTVTCVTTWKYKQAIKEFNLELTFLNKLKKNTLQQVIILVVKTDNWPWI